MHEQAILECIKRNSHVYEQILQYQVCGEKGEKRESKRREEGKKIVKGRGR